MAEEKKQTTKRAPRTKTRTDIASPDKTTVVAAQELGLTKDDTASSTAYAVWIRALLQNWRQGTVKVKTRSEVAKSRKKPWKQKGTGRARVGSARSPLWRGGGIIFGPQRRSRSLSVPAQVRSGVLRALFYQFADAQKVRVMDLELAAQRPSTATAAKALKQLGLDRKVTVLLHPHDALMQASFANIPFAQVLFFDQVNAFDLSNSDHVVVLKRDLQHLKEMVSRWN